VLDHINNITEEITGYKIADFLAILQEKYAELPKPQEISPKRIQQYILLLTIF